MLYSALVAVLKSSSKISSYSKSLGNLFKSQLNPLASKIESILTNSILASVQTLSATKDFRQYV